MDSPEPPTATDADLKWFFATPVAVYPWPDSEALNRELKAQILEAERKSGGRAKSVIGGWSSERTLLGWPGEAIRTFEARIKAVAGAMIRATAVSDEALETSFTIHAWANVLRDGGYHSVHSHPGSLWSGVYYVDVGELTGDLPGNGHIEFIDPRSATGGMNYPGCVLQSRIFMPTEPGTMILFPGWLKHMVHPYRGTGERISISFNLIPIRNSGPGSETAKPT